MRRVRRPCSGTARPPTAARPSRRRRRCWNMWGPGVEEWVRAYMPDVVEV